MISEINKEQWLIINISLIIVSNIFIFFNIPLLRQLFGIIFLTILPGLLIIHLLRLNEINLTEKILLIIGLSISFIMLFGVVLNFVFLSLDIKNPLSVVPILLSFDLVYLIVLFLGFKVNKKKIFKIPKINFSVNEKIFLIIPLLFPTLSIFGTHLMNSSNNNFLLILLLFLIPIYIVFICVFNQKFPKRLYPIIIVLIGLSVLLIFMLRFNHIWGHDVHIEYGMFFKNTVKNQHWKVWGNSTLDSCLSISLLPAVYNSILNVNSQEYLFKGLYVMICVFGPLAIFVITKKYLNELYAFLASFLFISQLTFLTTAGNPRTNVAIFFVALTIMILFKDNIEPLKKQILLIVFIMALIVSHYSTTYIFFFILILCWVISEIFSKKYDFNKKITIVLLLLFTVIMFLWYSQITETAFNASLDFLKKSAVSMKNMFIEEARTSELGKLSGQGLVHPVLSKINFVVTWSMFIFIGLGVLFTTIKFKKLISIFDSQTNKFRFLKSKIEIEHLIIGWLCAGLISSVVLIPFFSVGYDIQRFYSLIIIFLSLYFILGIIFISKFLKIKPYILILLIIVPYFLFITGVTYQLIGYDTSMILSSEGEEYEIENLYDQDSYSAKWLEKNIIHNTTFYTADQHGARKLVSQGHFNLNNILHRHFFKYKPVEGTLYLNYNNVVNKEFVVNDLIYEMSNFTILYRDLNKIYNNLGSEVYQ